MNYDLNRVESEHQGVEEVSGPGLVDLLGGSLAEQYLREEPLSEYEEFLDNFDNHLQWIGDPLIPPLPRIESGMRRNLLVTHLRARWLRAAAAVLFLIVSAVVSLNAYAGWRRGTALEYVWEKCAEIFDTNPVFYSRNFCSS